MLGRAAGLSPTSSGVHSTPILVAVDGTLDGIAALARASDAAVVVARNQGLKGGPAMGGSASAILFALDAAGLAKTTAFVTDGQLSGLCLKGLTVAEVAPEAATGGPIGKVRDGEIIRISVENRSIDLDVPAEELAARAGPGYVNAATGYLATFRQDVQPMSTGGVLLPLDD